MKRLKGRSILEIATVLIIMLPILWAWKLTPWAKLQAKHLYWNYFSHLIFILVPITIVLLTRRSFRSYGLSFKNWKCSLKWSLIFGGILGGVPVLSGLISRSVIIEESLRGYPFSTLMFQFVMVGFGEEFLFRGYFQSRMNEEFGRPFCMGGFRFGIGLIITSFLFGFVHFLNPFNPLKGSFILDWPALFMVSISGLFLGLVREKTESILAPMIIHGLCNSAFLLVNVTGPIFIGTSVGWFISWFLLWGIFGKTEIRA